MVFKISNASAVFHALLTIRITVFLCLYTLMIFSSSLRSSIVSMWGWFVSACVKAEKCVFTLLLCMNSRCRQCLHETETAALLFWSNLTQFVELHTCDCGAVQSFPSVVTHMVSATCSFFSYHLSSTEQNYDSGKLKLLAFTLAVQTPFGGGQRAFCLYKWSVI